jgi:formate dehydrogenase accessory protein FdhD
METDLDKLRDPLGLGRLGYAGSLLAHRAVRWDGGVSTESLEQVAEEVPVAIVYNGIPHVVMMATPADLEDFALGFSLTEELIGSPADFKAVEVIRYGQGIELQVTVSQSCEETIASRTRRLTGRTGCGICGADSVTAVLKQLHSVGQVTKVTAGALHRAVEALVPGQRLNLAAGAVHAAGWADLDGAVALIREDVGRHNALDKVIGALARQGSDTTKGFVVVTSRASFEMVQKATVLGATLLAAISGATGLAVRVAEQSGLTLVGFVRADRHTVYTHPERLTS